MSDIKSSIERELSIDDVIADAQKNITRFGNVFLDDALTGLLPNDLCLIGARSGIGKTQLATSIAAYNAAAEKKNVVFIALEAEPGEIELRLRYSIEAGLFYRDTYRDRKVTVSYRKWRLGFLQNDLKKYRDEARAIFDQRYFTLHTVYRNEHYGIADFEKTLDAAKEFGELIICDHLHFFDLEHNGSENSQVSNIMKRIRTLNLFYNKPFIVIAHLRKGIEGVVPGLEDFMGSSDIGKMATVAVMLAKDPEGYDVKNQLQKTIISIPKARTGGLGNLVGQIDYSISHQGYLPRYQLARVLKFKDKEKIERVSDEEIPEWATRAQTQVSKPAQ